MLQLIYKWGAAPKAMPDNYTKAKKIVQLFSIVFLLFIFCSVSTYAFGGGNTDEVETTDITDYKYRLWGDIYIKSDWIGYDLICSSGINSNVVGKDAEVAAAKCDVTKDKSIHVYPAWKIMTDIAALSEHGTSTSFTSWTYLFTSPGGAAEETKHAKWKELTPETINTTNYDKVKTTIRKYKMNRAAYLPSLPFKAQERFIR